MKPGDHLVLVIDDEPPIRRFLRASLSAEGYRVTEAATGEEGLKLAAQQPPDLVILDLGLPAIDGQEVLRAAPGMALAPILVLSARDQETQKVEALDAGADDYLTKPFGSENFWPGWPHGAPPYEPKRLRVIGPVDRRPACRSGRPPRPAS